MCPHIILRQARKSAPTFAVGSDALKIRLQQDASRSHTAQCG